MYILEFFTYDMDWKGKSILYLVNEPQSHIENVIFSFLLPCYKKNIFLAVFSLILKSFDHYSDLHFILFAVKRI